MRLCRVGRGRTARVRRRLARSIGAVFFGVLALGLEIGEQRKMQVPMTGKGRTARNQALETQGICVIDCNQFHALQYSFPPVPLYVIELRIFTLRRFAEFLDRQCRAMVDPAGDVLPTRGETLQKEGMQP
jgi:hypothetical protein